VPGDGIRWGIVGTANIVRGQFLPGLREAGGARAARVASRDPARAADWAAQHGVDQGTAGYESVTDADDIDAVYVALPNSAHAEWTTRALRAGKAVLSEKPLCVGAAQTAQVLDTAASLKDARLWEAFVFPFQTQHQRLVTLLADGAVGELAEISSAFHFLITRPGNIRLSAALGGGALADVGCYPIRLALELFGGPPAPAAKAPRGVGTKAKTAGLDGDVEAAAAAVIPWDAARWLTLTCGFRRPYDTFTRVLGNSGEICLTNPFHPSPADTLTIRRPGQDPVTEHPTTDQHSFTAALCHIHAVLRGEQPPQHTAEETALSAARLLESAQAACEPR
jgi:predicted dehydrogenase